MGMAASQARFLSLTARKSNVEYEGQQVNQQRTALANESANLYNRLTSIPVPTPPSTSDYYETVYTFTTGELDNSSPSGSTEYTLDNIYTMPDGMYARLSYTAYEWQAALSSAYSGSVNVDEANNKYSVNLANGAVYDAVKYHYEPAEVEGKFTVDENKKVTIGNIEFTLDDAGKNITGQDSEGHDISYQVTDNGDGTYTMKLAVQKPVEPDSQNYTVTIDGKTYNLTFDANSGTYTCADITGLTSTNVEGKYVDDDGKTNSCPGYFDDSFMSANGKKNQPILAYTIGNQTYFVSAQEFSNGSFASSSFVQNVGHKEYVDYPCSYSTASTGRYQTLYVTDKNGVQHTFDLNVQTVQDEEAYNQAMLDYEYEQAKYQKEVEDINSKTESLQQQDRTLELRLRQLDTEQNAIATEMDAVQKVIEDNIESTFKTFA